MEPFRKFSTKAFIMDSDISSISSRIPKLRDKILFSSPSVPLLRRASEASARPNKPVYKGRTPLKKDIIRVKLQGHDFEKAASLYSCDYSDVEDAVMFSTPPRRAPGPEAMPKNLTSDDFVSKAGLQKQSAPTPSAPFHRKAREVAKTIAIVPPRDEESDDSASFYSVDGTVYNENVCDDDMPPIPFSKFGTHAHVLHQTLSPSSALHGRPSRLYDVMKPVNQYELPPEVQRDLLPPNPVVFSSQFRASREREKEGIFRELETHLPPPRLLPRSALAKAGRSPVVDTVMQSSPPRLVQPMNRKTGYQVHHVRTTHYHHSQSVSKEQSPKLKVGFDSRPRDGSTMINKKALPAPPRPVDFASAATRHTDAAIRPLNVRKVDEDSAADSALSDGPTFTYTTGHFRMHSDAGRYGRLPSHLKKRYISEDGRILATARAPNNRS